jgi:hypothetical protein
MRKSGYYWVKTMNTTGGEEVIAEYDSEKQTWALPGSEMTLPESNLLVLSNELLLPTMDNKADIRTDIMKIISRMLDTTTICFDELEHLFKNKFIELQQTNAKFFPPNYPGGLDEHALQENERLKSANMGLEARNIQDRTKYNSQIESLKSQLEEATYQAKDLCRIQDVDRAKITNLMGGIKDVVCMRGQGNYSFNGAVRSKLESLLSTPKAEERFKICQKCTDSINCTERKMCLNPINML